MLMLRKLMKYEFMATGRIFLPLFAALLVISIVNRLFQNLDLRAPAIIGVVLSVILIAGILVLALILTLQRFRNNLLSSEGYLMMTLPVRTDGLILSKLFVASIWNVASGIVVTIAILIMAASGISLSDMVRSIREFFASITMPSSQIVLYAVEGLILGVLAIFSSVLLLYACMSLSMLVNRRRGLFTFGAFIVLTTVVQILVAILVSIGAGIKIYDSFGISSMSIFGQSQLIILAVIVVEAAMCAAYYFITRYMLKSRLNLQ